MAYVCANDKSLITRSDRVFVHALATVRRLPRTGSSRPPPNARLRLYGLYKQSMEGDVEAILPRPTLPISSPDPNGAHGNNNNNNNSVHRFASRDLRTRETQAEIEKWDAWHACASMSRTEAKRQYITTLIETMKEYASGTAESRELVGELEFVWNQIKSQSGSDPDEGSAGDKESPTRKLERAGLKQTASFVSSRPSVGGESLSRSLPEGTSRQGQQPERRRHSTTPTGLPPTRTQSGLRVLSPVSQRSDGSSVIEGVDPEAADDDEDAQLNTAPTSPIVYSSRPPAQSHDPAHSIPSDPVLTAWQSAIESHLRHLTTEIAALREQLSSNHLLSSSTYAHTYYTLTTRQRLLHHLRWWLRSIARNVFKHSLMQLFVLGLFLLWGRWKGDLRLEQWVRQRLYDLRRRLGSMADWAWRWLTSNVVVRTMLRVV